LNFFKDQKLKLLWVLSFLLIGSILRADDTIFPDAAHPTNEGYQGVIWNSSFKDLSSSKGKPVPFHPLPAERTVINDLLMALHPHHSATLQILNKSRILRVPGDIAHYVYYNDRFCMASLPVKIGDLEKVQAFLKTHFKPVGDPTTFGGTHQNGAEPEQPQTQFSFQRFDTQEFDDNYLMNKTGTRAYLVAFSKLSLKAFYLVYVSTDYLTSGNNAWAENQ
jgi:hypothetical protein